MKNPVSVKMPLSGNRSITFTVIGGKVQTIAQGYIDPREISEARSMALQKLADQTGREVEGHQPRFIPGQPARTYQTRLLQRPGRGKEARA